MICRVALLERPPGSVASDAAEGFRDWLKGLPGFVDGYHVQDSKTGRMLTITFWDSEDRLTEHEASTPPGGSLGIQTERLELFDMVERF
jgi:heme-degrading monooxygenase HmoA